MGGWRGDVENVMLDVLIGAGARGSSCVFLTDSHFEGGASRICRRLFALLSLFGALCVCVCVVCVLPYINTFHIYLFPVLVHLVSDDAMTLLFILGSK